MILNPEVQLRAHEELDRVCEGRLPEFSDYDNLPYIHAVLRECLRWHPAAALSKEIFFCGVLPTYSIPRTDMPHSSTEDDIYAGYFIKKGTSVVVNNW